MLPLKSIGNSSNNCHFWEQRSRDMSRDCSKPKILRINNLFLVSPLTQALNYLNGYRSKGKRKYWFIIIVYRSYSTSPPNTAPRKRRYVVGSLITLKGSLYLAKYWPISNLPLQYPPTCTIRYIWRLLESSDGIWKLIVGFNRWTVNTTFASFGPPPLIPTKVLHFWVDDP